MELLFVNDTVSDNCHGTRLEAAVEAGRIKELNNGKQIYPRQGHKLSQSTKARNRKMQESQTVDETAWQRNGKQEIRFTKTERHKST